MDLDLCHSHDYDRVNVKLLPDIIIKGGEYVESCEDVTTLE